MIGIVYGALVSLVQPDMKKLVAYSSVSHLGFVMLGIASFTTTAVVGSVYQMLNHGISTGALFFMVGMLYDRRHTRLIAEFGGLKTVMPWFSALFLLICLSSIAVPGLQRLRRRVPDPDRLLGLQPRPSRPWRPLGVILAAAYILWMVQRVLYGEVTNAKNAHAARPLGPRGRGARPPGGAGALHGRGQPALHAQDRALGGRPGAPGAVAARAAPVAPRRPVPRHRAGGAVSRGRSTSGRWSPP